MFPIIIAIWAVTAIDFIVLVAFVAMKLIGTIAWGWGYVLIPLWCLLAVAFIMVITMAIFMGKEFKR